MNNSTKNQEKKTQPRIQRNADDNNNNNDDDEEDERHGNVHQNLSASLIRVNGARKSKEIQHHISVLIEIFVIYFFLLFNEFSFPPKVPRIDLCKNKIRFIRSL